MNKQRRKWANMKKIATVTKVEETEQGLYFTVKPDPSAISEYQKPTKRPPARKPRNGHALSSFSMPEEHQGGRVRAWFARNAGLLCVAAGWALAFLSYFLVPDGGLPVEANSAVAAMICASWLLGIGVGLIFQSDRGKRDGR